MPRRHVLLAGWLLLAAGPAVVAAAAAGPWTFAAPSRCAAKTPVCPDQSGGRTAGGGGGGSPPYCSHDSPGPTTCPHSVIKFSL